MDAVGSMLSKFCRSWMLPEADPLYDFVVYREQKYCHETKRRLSQSLLIGVPGPERTLWLLGLVPVLFNWEDMIKPPLCRLPEGFQHVNIYPNGTVSCSILNEKELWSETLSVSELMFGIQQVLGHPNPSAPAQHHAYKIYKYLENPLQYNQDAEATAKKYAPNMFWELASKDFNLRRVDWKLIENQVFKHHKQPRPTEPRVPPLQKILVFAPALECNYCSCCAWGYYYEERDLRMYNSR